MHFRVRLNCIDHYQALPSRHDPPLRTRVPVIRIFGSTESGQRVCAHVHGVFPYLYVEYDGNLNQEAVGSFIDRLQLSIDRALGASYRQDRNGGARFVARITLVKGTPFFGYSVGYRFFLKIYLFNPAVMARLADLLQQGAIMKQRFQPYEAHLEYLLQFMIDYNLYGCDFVDSSQTYFRSPVPADGTGSGISSQFFWNIQTIPNTSITNDLALPRESYCSLEVDIAAHNITNRKKIRERRLHHDFGEFIKPPTDDVRLVSSMAGLWKAEAKRRQTQEDPASSFPRDFVSMSADPRSSQLEPWIHEGEYRQKVQRLVAQEKDLSHGMDLNLNTFVKPRPYEDSIQTALQSVQDLHPAQPDKDNDAVVDEFPLSQVEDEDWENLMMEFEAGQTKHTAQSHAPKHTAHNHAPKHTAQNHAPKHAAQSHAPKHQTLDYKNLFFGIGRSGLATGKLPRLPMSARLVEAAARNRLTKAGKAAGSRTPRVIHKRTASWSSDDNPAKRPKHAPIDESHSSSDLSSDYDPESDVLEPINDDAKHDASYDEFPDLTSSMSFSDYDPESDVLESINDDAKHDASHDESHLSSSDLSLSDYDPDVWEPISNDQSRVKHENEPPHLTSSMSFSEYVPSSDLESISNNQSKAKHENESPHLTSSMLSDYVPSSDLESISNDAKHDASHNKSPHLSSSDEPQSDLESSSSSPRHVVTYAVPPPSVAEVALDLPVTYQEPFYSRKADVATQRREYAGKEFRLTSNTLPDFCPTGLSPQIKATSWEIAKPPPTYDEVLEWCQSGKADAPPVPSSRLLSQIEGPTQTDDFKYSQKAPSAVPREAQYMSIMSLEVHVNTRGDFVPDPEQDEVQCIFWRWKDDDAVKSGILVLSADGDLANRTRHAVPSDQVVHESSELDLLNRMIEIVRVHDPDVLTGYEVHGSSWGYLIERARLKYDYDLCHEFSRMRAQSKGRFGKESDQWGFNTTSTIRITGRHMINIWRAMRSELNLAQYTMENVTWHLSHRRIPHYSCKSLTAWLQSGKPRDLHRVLRYYRARSRIDLEILECNELISRTSEQARLLGVDFFSVFSRGSQFKVESIMFRIAKPENFMLVSPSRRQVGQQNALECLPLVMEPQSAFYNSPLVVLDFQSLYPSIMIAYNYCYSTFLGRITHWRGKSKMGFTDYRRQDGLLALLEDHINIAPNGMMYVKPEVRKSLLAKMLTEILETRIMVKDGMKQDKDDKTLQQLLNNRQLALKLLANVTYGYTSASFSGRMPCSEIADSIVQTGRETLERAAAYIHSVERWGAQVVYGDTDSLFIYLEGRSRDAAFTIGQEIAQAITERNPQPIKLKFEKVYHPCVLLAKKRYVGYKYETRDQAKPEFDAKGIETVRRDGTPAEQKMEEKALRLLFETADLSQVKRYFQRQCKKVMRGKVSIQDFCFAKEVRLGSYSARGPPPPGALISAKKMQKDARAEPQYGERVPYVVIYGAPGARLVDRCVSPEELLRNPHWQLDAEYYISKNMMPPLERIFSLVGASVKQWYDAVPKIRRLVQTKGLSTKKRTLEAYMLPVHCIVCRRKISGTAPLSLCRLCFARPATLLTLQTRLTAAEHKYDETLRVCQGCEGIGPLEEVGCTSHDCPVFWRRNKLRDKMLVERAVTGPVICGINRQMEW
ncbi:hypothetical protein ACQKWADRAFT_317212 [Trichoderma austrokoningii]